MNKGRGEEEGTRTGPESEWVRLHRSDAPLLHTPLHSHMSHTMYPRRTGKIRMC